MLKLLGAVFLLVGGGGLGLGAIRKLEGRVTALRALVEALELMERELGFRLTPMRELLEGTARRVGEPVAGFLAACARGLDELGERPLSELWAEEAGERLTALRPRDLEAVLSMGAVLGRYDAEGQRGAIAASREELAGFLAAAAEERRKQGRVYGALGLTAGAFLVILLI